MKWTRDPLTLSRSDVDFDWITEGGLLTPDPDYHRCWSHHTEETAHLPSKLLGDPYPASSGFLWHHKYLCLPGDWFWCRQIKALFSPRRWAELQTWSHRETPCGGDSWRWWRRGWGYLWCLQVWIHRNEQSIMPLHHCFERPQGCKYTHVWVRSSIKTLTDVKYFDGYTCGGLCLRRTESLIGGNY